MTVDLAPYRDLALHIRGGMGSRPGEHRFPGRPQPAGIEVESYTPYAAGDDLRHLDWNALARLDTLLVRRFTAERSVTVHLLVDTSASMGVPEDDGKLGAACDLATVLAFVALSSGDTVYLTGLGGDATTGPAYRHASSLEQIMRRLADTRATGFLALDTALEAYARRVPGAGAAILISDLMTEPETVERGVQALRAAAHDVLLVHTLGPGEVDPTRHFASGVLVDPESGATHPMALTAAVRARYDALLADHLAALEALAARNGARYARLSTAVAVRRFVLDDLARRGIVRQR